MDLDSEVKDGLGSLAVWHGVGGSDFALRFYLVLVDIRGSGLRRDSGPREQKDGVVVEITQPSDLCLDDAPELVRGDGENGIDVFLGNGEHLCNGARDLESGEGGEAMFHGGSDASRHVVAKKRFVAVERCPLEALVRQHVDQRRLLLLFSSSRHLECALNYNISKWIVFWEIEI